MLSKFYHSNRFEESLGVIGLVYFLIIIIATYFLTHFLIDINAQLYKPIVPTSSAIASFNLESAKNLEKVP